MEKIVGSKLDEKYQKLYLVKWLNYDSSYNTWEPKSSFECPETVLSTIKFDCPEEILNDKIENGIKYYLVKWKNFDDRFNHWVHENSVVIKDVIDVYESK